MNTHTTATATHTPRFTMATRLNHAREFDTLDAAIDYAMAHRADYEEMPVIREFGPIPDGIGRRVVNEWHFAGGDCATYYLAKTASDTHDEEIHRVVRVGDQEYTSCDGTVANMHAIQRGMEADGWTMTARTVYLDGHVPMGFQRATPDGSRNH